MVALNKIKEFGRQIGEQFGAERVILFGSYAQGNLEEGKVLYETNEKPSPSEINNNWDEAAAHSGQDARVTRGRDARDT